MNKINLYIVLLFAVSSILHSQVINLETAINIALKQNIKVKQYEEKLHQNKYNDMEAWGNFLPSVDFQSSYNHLNDPMQIDLNPIRDVIINIQAKNQTELTNIYNLLQGKMPLSDQEKGSVFNQVYARLNGDVPSFVETFKEQNFQTATLTAIQPLFTGGKIYAGKKYAASEKAASKYEVIKTQNEITQEVVNNYLAIVLLQNIVKTRQNVLKGISKHKSDAEKLYKQGIIANYHMLRADVAVAEAEQNLFDDKNKLEFATLNLKHLLNLYEDFEIIISDTLIFTEIDNSLSLYLSKAIQDQPILKMIGSKKDAAKSKYIAERAEFLPQIVAFGKYEMLPEYLSSLEPRWAVGVQLKFNIFKGFKNYSKLQSAKHLEREVTYIQKDAESKIDLWINKAFIDVKNSEEKYKRLSNTLKLAGENLRMNTIRFQSGMGTSLEVIDAQLSLEKNEIEKLKTLYEYYRSLTDLFTATGNTKDILKVWQEVR